MITLLDSGKLEADLTLDLAIREVSLTTNWRDGSDLPLSPSKVLYSTNSMFISLQSTRIVAVLALPAGPDNTIMRYTQLQVPLQIKDVTNSPCTC